MSLLTNLDILVRNRTDPTVQPLRNQLGCAVGDDWVETACYQALQSVHVVLDDFGCGVVELLVFQTAHFLSDNAKRNNGPEWFIKLLKAFFAWPLSVYAHRNDADAEFASSLIGNVAFCSEVKWPADSLPFLSFLHGPGRTWVRNRLSVIKGKNARLWMSWFQMKRNTPVVPDHFVTQSYVNHWTLLSSEDPADSVASEQHPAFSVDTQAKDVFFHLRRSSPAGFVPSTSVDGAGTVAMSDLLKEEIRAVAHALERADLFDLRAPGASACYTHTRAGGGQRRGVLDALVQRKLITPDHFVDIENECLSGPEFLSMSWYPVLRLSSGSLFNVCLTEYGHPDLRTAIKKVCTLAGHELLDGIRPEVWMKPTCQIQGVLEPLKVRVISKGPSLLYWRCKPMQKAMHGALRRLPAYRLVGRTLSITDVMDVLTHRLIGSVDYSSATDSVSGVLGQVLVDLILAKSNIEDNCKEAVRLAFGFHNLEYKIPSPGGKKVTTVCKEQTRGQLMGSIISFPVLCMLNMLTYRLTAEVYEPYLYSDVLVNGDDMLYSCDDPTFWETQCRWARAIGFEPSLGKCYLSNHMCTINTTLFTKRKRDVRLHDFLNVGLLHGVHRVGGERLPDHFDLDQDVPIARSATSERVKIVAASDEFAEQNSLATCFDRVLSGANDKKSVMGRFLSYNKNTLTEECRGRNMFLPCWLGGLGQTLPEGCATVYTLAQKCLARRRWDAVRSRVDACLTAVVGPRNRNVRPFDEEPRTSDWSDPVERDVGGGQRPRVGPRICGLRRLRKLSALVPCALVR